MKGEELSKGTRLYGAAPMMGAPRYAYPRVCPMNKHEFCLARYRSLLVLEHGKESLLLRDIQSCNTHAVLLSVNVYVAVLYHHIISMSACR